MPDYPQNFNDRYMYDGIDVVSPKDIKVEVLAPAKLQLFGDVELNGYDVVTELNVPAIDVRDFGAKVDGVTNDQAAWTNAIAESVSSGRPVIVPKGTSIVSGLVLPTGVILQGFGSVSRLKLAANSTNAVIRLSTDQTQCVQLRNFVIDGNRSAQTDVNCHGINFGNRETAYSAPWQTYFIDSYHKVIDVLVHNCKGKGVRITGRGDSTYVRVQSYLNDGGGFFITGFDHWFTDCVAGSNTGYGFEVGCTNTNFNGCKSFLATSDDFFVYGYYNRFVGCSSQGAGRYGFDLYLAVGNIVEGLTVIDSNYTSGGNGYSIVFSGGGDNKISAHVSKVEVAPTPTYAVFFLTASPRSRVEITADPADFVTAVIGGSAAAQSGSYIRTNAAEAQTTLTFATTVVPDMSRGWKHIVTLTGNILVNRPINCVDGDELTMVFIQDATGGRTVTWGTGFPDKTWVPLATANGISVARFILQANNFYRIT